MQTDTKLLAYNISYSRYTGPTSIQRQELCNGFMVTNIGDTDATINGKILFASATPLTDQGDSVTIGGNEGEIYYGNLDIAFVQPIGANPLVEVIQKYYIQIRK